MKEFRIITLTSLMLLLGIEVQAAIPSLADLNNATNTVNLAAQGVVTNAAPYNGYLVVSNISSVTIIGPPGISTPSSTNTSLISAAFKGTDSNGKEIVAYIGTSLTNKVNTQTSDYAALATDTFILISAAHKVTMPNPATAGIIGKMFWIQQTGSGTNAIMPYSAETFNGNMGTGLAKLTNSAQGKVTQLWSDGTNWRYSQQ